MSSFDKTHLTSSTSWPFVATAPLAVLHYFQDIARYELKITNFPYRTAQLINVVAKG